jgi:hypothetical protein
MKTIKNKTSFEVYKGFIKNNINPITGWKADQVEEPRNKQ